MESCSRILIIGGTGYIGRHISKASLALGHPTFLLVREATTSNPEKAKLLESFKASGAIILHGTLEDQASLVWAIKRVDVVISAVKGPQLMDQLNIIKAIKEVGTIKRFLPSEFGNDVDKTHAVEPAKTMFASKAKIRRAIEAEGIPYTYVASNCFAGFFLPSLGQPGLTAPPRDKIVIAGDGNAKAVFVKEEDIGTFTIKAVDDPRTLNKILYLRLPANTYSINELVALWEKKIGKTLEKTYITEEEVLKKIAGVIHQYGAEKCVDITTRQNWQIRGVVLDDVPVILKALKEVGLSSLQSGMENVRNPVGSPLVGIDPLFQVLKIGKDTREQKDVI